MTDFDDRDNLLSLSNVGEMALRAREGVAMQSLGRGEHSKIVGKDRRKVSIYQYPHALKMLLCRCLSIGVTTSSAWLR